jgi:propanol-preferring alcohol dehydrogenase
VKAYQFSSPANGLELVEVEPAHPGSGQVAIDVEAAGMCQSDVHIVNGHGDDWLRQRPIVLGHEVAGRVRELGPGVTGVGVGDRVAIALASHPIEHADFANSIGLGFDGGYAPRALARVESLVQIPDNVSFADAAVATDSVATAYHAVVAEAEVGPGANVAIIGLGGLGLNAVKISTLFDANVFGVDINPETFATARALGAESCYANIADIPAAIDVAIDFAGVGSTTTEAVAAVRPGGRVVLVGLGASESLVSTYQLVIKNVRLVVSIGASVDELRAVLELISKGLLTPVLEEVAFADLPAALARLEAGDVRGRIFTRPGLNRGAGF